MKLTDEQLLNTKGGAISISSTFLNALARTVSVLLDLGRTIGTSIYRYKNKNYCA